MGSAGLSYLQAEMLRSKINENWVNLKVKISRTLSLLFFSIIAFDALFSSFHLRRP
jgi:hypothetical protein